jgi:hypothetical protein
MEKVPCNDCGALILPTTAESTGGICMACKQGIRRIIEKSRAFYKAQRQYDPVRELWVSLVNRSSNDPDLSTFSKSEITYFTIGILEGEIYNGGFDQFFSNSSGMYYEEAALGLAEIGAHQSLTILKQASAAIFGRRAPPKNRSERWKLMNRGRWWKRWIASNDSIVEALDKQFWADPDKLADLLNKYAEDHCLAEPFIRPEQPAS